MSQDLEGVAVLFDLDGTLIDTAPDLIDTVDTVVTARGHPCVPPQVLRPLIGHGARRMIAVALERMGDQPDKDELDRIHADYLVHYESRIAALSKPFPGVVEALDTLAAAGARFGVCTNKMSHLAVTLLDALNLSPRFEVIAGPDTYGAAKPDPRMLLEAMEAIGATHERTVYVGDSRIDVNAARNAFLPIVGVSFGYSEMPMATLAPDVLIEHYDGLAGGVRQVLARED